VQRIDSSWFQLYSYSRLLHLETNQFVAYRRPWTASSHTCPVFEGEHETPILAIPVSTRAPSADSTGTMLGSFEAGFLKRRIGKRKVSSTPAPPAKAKKVVGKKATCIKINKLGPQMQSAPTPLSSTRGGFRMCHTTR
jgi:hypothetical protein